MTVLPSPKTGKNAPSVDLINTQYDTLPMQLPIQYPNADRNPAYGPKAAFAYAYTPASSSGLRSASDWNTRASMYMPVPAISHAMIAPNGPVASPKVRGNEKMPAPTIDPTTIP